MYPYPHRFPGTIDTNGSASTARARLRLIVQIDRVDNLDRRARPWPELVAYLENRDLERLRGRLLEQRTNGKGVRRV